MIVAAGNRTWFPRFFTVIGRVGLGSRIEGDQLPNAAEGDSDAPLNALILSAILSSLYILLGNFRALLLFNGLGEYTFFLIAVLGVVLLRFKQPDLVRPYKPPILIPIIFAVVSGFVVVRGALFAPTQAIVLLVLWGLGLGYYKLFVVV